MNGVGKVESPRGPAIAAIVVVCVLSAAVAVILRGSHVSIGPPSPPAATTAPVELPPTTSHLSVAVNCPKAALVAQLESAIPTSYQFDVNSEGVRAYGNPSRGQISVTIDPAAKRVSASTTLGGRVQVEKTVLAKISVGIDITGTIDASLVGEPTIDPNWAINPHFELSGHVERAVAKTAIGDVDVTDLVQGPVGKALNSAKGTAEAKVKEALDVRQKVEGIWNEIGSVQKIAESPPTWLRITPQRVRFAGFEYADQAISSGLALDLEMRVFIQDTAPQVIKTPLPQLAVGGPISDEFELSTPIEISYAIFNEQLKAQLPKQPVLLPQNAFFSIDDATVAPLGNGLMLTVNFNARKGRTTANGRLYIVGVPVYDAAKAELRVEELEFSVETKNILLKAADWLAHDSLLAELQQAVVFQLQDDLARATAKANAELEELKGKPPNGIGAVVKVTDLSVERLAFAKDRGFAIVTAKGKMSARLQP